MVFAVMVSYMHHQAILEREVPPWLRRIGRRLNTFLLVHLRKKSRSQMSATAETTPELKAPFTGSYSSINLTFKNDMDVDHTPIHRQIGRSVSQTYIQQDGSIKLTRVNAGDHEGLKLTHNTHNGGGIMLNHVGGSIKRTVPGSAVKDNSNSGNHSGNYGNIKTNSMDSHDNDADVEVNGNNNSSVSESKQKESNCEKDALLKKQLSNKKQFQKDTKVPQKLGQQPRQLNSVCLECRNLKGLAMEVKKIRNTQTIQTSQGKQTKDNSTQVTSLTQPSCQDTLNEAKSCSRTKKRCERHYAQQEEILKQLSQLLMKQEQLMKPPKDEVNKEWHEMAEIIDRCFFWFYLTVTCLVTIIILLLVPLGKSTVM